MQHNYYAYTVISQNRPTFKNTATFTFVQNLVSEMRLLLFSQNTNLFQLMGVGTACMHICTHIYRYTLHS